MTAIATARDCMPATRASNAAIHNMPAKKCVS